MKRDLDYLKKDYISILQSFLAITIDQSSSSLNSCGTGAGAIGGGGDNVSLSNFSVCSGSSSTRGGSTSSAKSVKLFGGDKHKKRLRDLLEECRQKDPTLPTWDSLVGDGTFVDKYGFKYNKSNESNVFHYVCHQLNMFFDNHLNHVEEKFWKTKLKEWKNGFVLTVPNKQTQKLKIKNQFIYFLFIFRKKLNAWFETAYRQSIARKCGKS